MSRIAYFDCFSGISGDMLIAALLDAGADFEALKSELAKLGLSNYELRTRKVTKQHIAATKFDVLDKVADGRPVTHRPGSYGTQTQPCRNPEQQIIAKKYFAIFVLFLIYSYIAV